MKILAAAALAAALAAAPARAESGAALAVLAADRIDAALGDVARSVEAIGAEWSARVAEGLVDTGGDWSERATLSAPVTAYRTWPEAAATPVFQAEALGLYGYAEGPLSPGMAAELGVFEDLAPLLRAAYRSFPYSWVYLTGADGQMAIYPFLPIEEAAHNDPPTEQVYYLAADFAGGAVGWTAPYLDLVGAGMMITASFPVRDGATLLGVASRDITLRELSQAVLRPIAQAGEATAALIDGAGLAIAGSDATLQTEIDALNDAAGAAVVHLRGPDAAAELGHGARTLDRPDLVAAVERALAGETAFEIDGREVWVAEIPRTGWRFVLLGGGA